MFSFLFILFCVFYFIQMLYGIISFFEGYTIKQKRVILNFILNPFYCYYLLVKWIINIVIPYTKKQWSELE